MIYSFRSNFEKNPLLSDFIYAFFFGILSLGLGELKFDIPGVVGGSTDLREIPLIVSVFYIKNPLFLIISCLITTIDIGLPGEGSAVTTFVMHIIPAFITWWFYRKTSEYFLTTLTKGILWVFYIIIYYGLLLIPMMILSDLMVGVNVTKFMPSYFNIMGSIRFEMVATSLITSLYLVQFETRENIQQHKNNLEQIVESRTAELALANKTLTYLNENLDDLVKHRSKKISEQLNLIIRYAHMNSHEVRAPLARILGLLEIIKLEKTVVASDKIVNELCKSGDELDEVIKNMNRLLEKEIDSNEKS